MSVPKAPKATASSADTPSSVLAAVERIPPGRVMSYGDVAEYAGCGTARLVGRILATDAGTVPWHRVLRADGTPAPHLAGEQLARLREEGVAIRNGRVVMKLARWDGRPL